MSRPLPPLAPGQCCALVETTEGAKSYSMQRIRVTVTKRCSRKAKTKIGPLDLCTVHARLAREGFVAEDGQVSDSADIATMRRYPKKFPGGQHSWHRQYPEQET